MPKVKHPDDSLAIYIAKILFAILILLAFFTTYLIILGRDSQSYEGNTRKLRATPNSTSFFLSNHYQTGAEPFELTGESGTFLGADRSWKVLAVNMRYQEDGGVDTKDLLQVYDIATRQRRHEIAASGCSNVSVNNLVYCYDEDDRKIHGINVLSGASMSEIAADADGADAAADTDAAAVGGGRVTARLLGSQQQTDILQIHSGDHVKLAALSGNEARWDQPLAEQEECSLIDRGRTIVCQKPAPGRDGGTTIRTLRTSDGGEIGNRNTQAEIALTSDGWMEKSPDYESAATTAAFTSHVSVTKAEPQPTPQPNKIFGVDAREKGTSQTWSGTAFFPRAEASETGNTETLTYPSHVLEAIGFHPGGIVTADGEINLVRVPSHNPNDSSYAHVGGPDIVFSISAADKILTSSKNGKLVLLKLDNSANTHNDVFTIYDTETRTTVLDVEDTGKDEITVINGLLAQTKKTPKTGSFEKLVIFLPA